jgi:predicted HAD superfamily hydrolase
MNSFTDSLLESAQFSPFSLQSPEAWCGHLPFAAWLTRTLAPKLFVELGTHSGNSYFAFCQAVREAGLSTRCYAVDTWRGDEYAGRYGDDVFEQVHAHNRAHYAGFSNLLRMTFDEALGYFADGSIDLLHIDGLHTYEAVKHDFDSWRPKLAPGAVVLFHDTAVREHGFGVWKLWEELQARYAGHLEFSHSHGLGVVQIDGAEAEPPAWLEPKSLAQQQLKRYFAALGAQQLERYELNRTQTRLARLTQTVAERDGQLTDLRQALSDRDEEIANLKQAVAECNFQIAELNRSVSSRDQEITGLNQTIDEISEEMGTLRKAALAQDVRLSDITKANSEKDFQIQHLAATASAFQAQNAALEHWLSELLNSSSWRVTRPMRFLSRLLKGDWLAVKDGLSRHLGFLFPRRLLGHETRLLLQGSGSGLDPEWHSNLVDIDAIPPAAAAGSIGVHIHVFYQDLVDEFAGYLKNIPFPFDLFISVVDKEGQTTCKRAFAKLINCRKLTVRIVENRGRDIAPLFCAFGEELAKYDYVCHLHSKKSHYNKGATEGWREYLCTHLMGSKERVQKIIGLMQDTHGRGIVYPQNFVRLPYMANSWLANRAMGAAWCTRLGIRDIPSGYFDFPAGSMFWARGDALAPLFKAGIKLNDFPEEAGQTDGTLAHCIERLFGVVPASLGLPPGIIRDVQCPSWSTWRFDHYMNRTFQDLVREFYATDVKVIAFDIFDTLLCRPFLDAESVKAIVARRSGPEAGRLYHQHRFDAENLAREKKGSDVCLDEVYAQMAELTGLPRETLAELQRFEEEVEMASVGPREQCLALYRQALATGKPVLLLSDMFLPRALVEKMLARHGIEGFEALYLSNDVGLRKDSGKLYEHVFARYAVKPSEFLMVGDNERSDFQIPCDLGARSLYMLKPVEIARSLPRFGGLIRKYEKSDLDSEITLGLVVRKNFAHIANPGFDPQSLVDPTPYNLGYSLVGPLLVGFAQWLVQTSGEDGMQRLYFLSREGKLIKQVYDFWTQGLADATPSDYLVLSRRAVSVPTCTDFDDILEIAKTNYCANSIENFLLERYGLILEDKRWKEITRSLGWKRSDTVEVEHKKIPFLVPLLQELSSEILENAKSERAGLMAYLAGNGLNNKGRYAVVDVGYGGTIQKYLNRTLGGNIHGYYLMTDERIGDLTRDYDIVTRGCFLERVNLNQPLPRIYKYSFDLEKFLSADEPQVVRYETDDNGHAAAVFRTLSDDERGSYEFRKLLTEGVMNYVCDARTIRETMVPDFVPSLAVAKSLYESFVSRHSESEKASLATVTLDDYYYGRGLVS